MTENAISEYISGFPVPVQEILQNIRKIIREEAPEATETIKYQIPTFVFHGNLVHFAAYQNHVGFYPTPSGIEKFKKQLSGFASAKGSVKFPLNREIPYHLIREIVKWRVEENSKNSKPKS